MYIVTIYGCNSTPSDMWIPQSKLFVNYQEAYSYFLEVSPSLTDEYNIAKQYINSEYKEDYMGLASQLSELLTEGYMVIENRVQIAGYENGFCAKRPCGAVIAKIG